MAQSNKGAEKAAKIQAEANRYASDLLYKSEAENRAQQLDLYNNTMAAYDKQNEFNKGQAQLNVDMYQPLVDNYYNALKQVTAGSGEDGWLSTPYTIDDLNNDPGMQFRSDEGNKALNNSIAAKNGVLSGAAVKQAQAYNSGLASQEYAAGFARDQQLKSNRLQGLGIQLQQGQFGMQGVQNSRYMSQEGDQANNVNTNYGNLMNSISSENASAQSNLALQNGQTQADYALAMANNKGNVLQNTLSGAMSGAMAGSAAGHWGMFAGALGGGALGAAGGGNKQSSGLITGISQMMKA